MRVVYDDGSSSEWPPDTLASSDDALDKAKVISDIARRKAILDYRSLLRTNYGGKGLERRLFDLAVSALLTNVEVPTSAGVYRINKLWQEVQDRYSLRRTAKNLQELGDAINLFNDSMRWVLARIEIRVGEILKLFVGHGLQVRLDFPGVTYDKTTRNLNGSVIYLDISYRGEKLGVWTDFLNEARLTALALAMYLGATLEQNPLPPPDTAAPLKLLVLDDVLIGLDMSNRLPVLESLGALTLRIIRSSY